MLLEKLCNAYGVSGNENEIRNIIKAEVLPYSDDIYTDNIGNLLVFKKGISNEKTVMMSAHMDEVGFIISGINKDGYLSFRSVGGIDTRVIISKKVCVRNNKIRGIIGIKAIHLVKKSERENVPDEEDLFIDIGAKNEDEARKYVSEGDYASFDTDFEIMGSCIKSKAIDDRVGCYTLCRLIKEKPLYDTWFSFVVQEEVGLRGAKVAAARIKPDLALVFEGTTASDVPGSDDTSSVTKLGSGAAISYMDRSTIVPRKYYKWLYELGVRNNIPVQYKTMASGGNDAGIIHLSDGGVWCASLSVPCRYIHSPVSVAALNDIESIYKLGLAFMKNTNEMFDIIKKER